MAVNKIKTSDSDIRKLFKTIDMDDAPFKGYEHVNRTLKGILYIPLKGAVALKPLALKVTLKPSAP